MGMDALVAIGTTVAYLASILELVLFAVGISPDKKPAAFFDTSTMLLAFISLGKMLEVLSKSKTSAAVTELLQLRPEKAVVLEPSSNGSDSKTSTNRSSGAGTSRFASSESSGSGAAAAASEDASGARERGARSRDRSDSGDSGSRSSPLPEAADMGIVDGTSHPQHKEATIRAELLEAGTLLKLKEGNRIPADGTVLAGTAEVDESMLTGESVP